MDMFNLKNFESRFSYSIFFWGWGVLYYVMPTPTPFSENIQDRRPKLCTKHFSDTELRICDIYKIEDNFEIILS